MRLINSLPRLVWLFTGMAWSVMLVSCNPKNTEEKNGLTGEMAEGQKLAARYCTSCHAGAEPGLLDRVTWKERVLPAMAKQLGLEVWQKNHYFQNSRSSIPLGDWTKIVAYYDSLAPAKLSPEKSPLQLVGDWSLFSLKAAGKDTASLATTTLTAINKLDHHIYTSSAENPDLWKWNQAMQPTRVARLPAPAVHISFAENYNLVTSIGEMKAYDAPTGALYQLSRTETSAAPQVPVASHFIRPIQTAGSDFNKDGRMDYLVCSFGHTKGGLYLLKQLPDKTFEKIPVREVPGATQAVTGDFNQDGWPDIMALFAHADEGIWLFLNDHKGGFKAKNVLRFPPVYGSSSFQLVDMNRDGKLDIVYTAGDNSDYSRILKPYHGLYIFISQGDLSGDQLQFEQAGFYPIHGATKVIAKDFDLDGDTDLAVIAFFADFKNNPSKSFIYFEQKNTKSFPDFTAHAVPISKSGRWICMDAEDLDGDGDTDLVLGNYAKGFLNQEDFKPDWNMHLPFVVLENKLK